MRRDAMSKKIIAAIFPLVLGLLLLPARGQAALHTWTGNVSNLWKTDANWDPPGTPGLDDKAIINNGNTVIMDLTPGVSTNLR
jgi:hypothetical protein